MAKRYRDLEARTLVDVGARSIPTGGAQAAQQLAESFSAFSRGAAAVGGLATTFGAERLAETGAQEGLAGTPEMRRGIASLTKYGRAYNSAALRGYAIRSDLDANNTAARLEVEAGTDPERFQKTMDASRDAVLAEAPAEARAVLQEIYAKRTGEGLARINGALATELRNEDRSLIAENVAQKTERIAYLRSLNTPEAFAEADEEEVKLTMLIDGAVGDGSMSETEGIAARRGIKRDILMATILERFKNELNDIDGDPIAMLELVQDVVRQDQSLTPEEEAKLEESLFAELRDRNALDSMRAAAQDSEREARYAEGNRIATAELLSSSLTRRRLLQMVQADQLDPNRATTLQNELENGANRLPRSNQQELASARLNLLSLTEEDILTNQELTWEDRGELILKRREESAGWKGTQVAREAFDRIDRALGIIPGTNPRELSLPELQQRDAALTELYDLVDALPPEERQGVVLAKAQEVINTRIRASAAEELVELRRNLDRWLSEQENPEDMNATEKETYDKILAGRQAAIREAEAKAGGGQ